MAERIIDIYPARDMPHAHMLLAALDGEGIPAHISNQGLAFGGLYGVLTDAPHILVRESDAERALDLLQVLERRGAALDEDWEGDDGAVV